MRYFRPAFFLLFVLSAPKAVASGSSIMLMPGLTCGGSTITAASVLYLPLYNCFVSRASVGTYTDVTGTIQTAAANIQRIDYNPTTHALNGILLEPAATNMVPHSTNFSNTTYWSTNGSPTWTADTTAPDGSTAYSVSGSAAFSGVFKSITVVASTVYTYSVYFKYISGDVNIRIGIGGAYTDIDSSTGTISFTSGATGTPTVTSVGNGWYRGVISVTTGGTSAAAINYTRTNNATKAGFWGAQLELGSVATSYLPTTGSAATRSADVYQQP